MNANFMKFLGCWLSHIIVQILGALYILGPNPLEGNPFDMAVGSTIGSLYYKWVDNWASQCKPFDPFEGPISYGLNEFSNSVGGFHLMVEVQ
jgi:hypothetical protein